jgi:hypothetical protein
MVNSLMDETITKVIDTRGSPDRATIGNRSTRGVVILGGIGNRCPYSLKQDR